MRTIKSLPACLVVLGLSFVPSVALARQDQSSTGDPVADAARRAREQKKLAPKPKKVFTDEDIAPKPAVDVPAPREAPPNADKSDGAVAAGTTAKSGASEKKEDTSSEAFWRKRFATQRKRIADAEEELGVLVREAEKADLQYYPDPQKAMQEQYTRQEINEKNEKIAAKKKEVADLKQQLGDLEDQLRSAGGDPGWAR